jgi:hypothetical protein
MAPLNSTLAYLPARCIVSRFRCFLRSLHEFLCSDPFHAADETRHPRRTASTGHSKRPQGRTDRATETRTGNDRGDRQRNWQPSSPSRNTHFVRALERLAHAGHSKAENRRGAAHILRCRRPNMT